jgi:AraC-like DNA-binding protein
MTPSAMSRLRYIGRHHMPAGENPQHSHDHAEAVLYLKGQGRVVVDGQSIPFGPGTIVCAGPGVPHLEQARAPYHSLSFGFTETRHGSRLRLCQDGPGEPIGQLVAMLEREYHRKGPHWERLCDEGLSFFLTWIEARGESHGENPWVARVEDLLLGHLTQPGFRLLTALSRLGPSPAHLIRLFSKARGSSPLKYLLHLRVKEAQHLLEVTSLPIHHVARRVGFDDPYYFSRTFRKITGLSPSEARLKKKLR